MIRLDVDFQSIKNFLLKEFEINEFISSSKTEEEALLIYWAIDNISRDQHKLSKEELSCFSINRKLLEEIRQKILSEELRLSLSHYSHGFVLGALEFSARNHEASIEHFKEYMQIVQKLETWKDIGFPSERFQKHWEHAMIGIHEIQNWLEDKSEAFYPAMAAIIRSGQYKNSSKFLKALRKGNSDKITFQILSSILQTNPLLNERLVNLCETESIAFPIFIGNAVAALELLKQQTTDMRVKEHCQLILKKLSTSI
ncbi:MAG: hypothetical protein ACFFE8_10175 [Candidatus Heimdallarchaeota archaeon]